MNYLKIDIENYLEYCRTQKRLDKKTLKAYRIDLHQFSGQILITKCAEITITILETYIAKHSPTICSQNRKKKNCFFESILSLSRI